MKNQFTSRIVKFTFAFMFILIASSCSEDNDTLDAAALAKEINSEIAAKGAKVSAAGAVASYIATPAPTGCGDACVNEPVEQVSSQTINWGNNNNNNNNNNTKDITVTAWNDNDKFYIKVNSTVNIDGVKISYPYTEKNNGIDYNYVHTGLTGYEFTYEYDLQENWEACDAQNYAVRVEGSGGAAEFGLTTYNLFEICPPLCSESFSYENNGSGSYTFTYVPAVDMVNVNVEFTFAQGVAVSGLIGFTRNGNGNASVWSATSSFEVCKTYTYTVTLTPDCSGNSNNSNVWTDFKVGDESKKGELANIVISCSN